MLHPGHCRSAFGIDIETCVSCGGPVGRFSDKAELAASKIQLADFSKEELFDRR